MKANHDAHCSAEELYLDHASYVSTRRLMMQWDLAVMSSARPRSYMRQCSTGPLMNLCIDPPCLWTQSGVST